MDEIESILGFYISSAYDIVHEHRILIPVDCRIWILVLVAGSQNMAKLVHDDTTSLVAYERLLEPHGRFSGLAKCANSNTGERCFRKLGERDADVCI